MKTDAAPTGIYVRLVLVAVVWGASFIAGRVVSGEIDAISAALWRYAVATTTLLATALVIEKGLPRLSGRQWLGVVVLGLLGVSAYNLCFMYGLQTVPASRASLIIALNPAATLIGGALFLHEPLTRNRILGIAMALLGVAVELSNGNPRALFTGTGGLGELAMFGCVISWAAYTLLGKRLLGEGVSALAATTYAALAGTLMLLIFAGATHNLDVPNLTTKGWWALVFIGVFSTALAYIWFYDGVLTIGPARTAVFINLVPVVAIALGVLLLGEKLTPPIVIGAALVVSGVFIINRTPALAADRHHACAHTG
jgi:drug/metabolite transporter (DMT)-like permease